MPKRYACSFLFISVCAYLIRVNHSANILCMFTSSGESHLTVFMAVANSLIERGHNVTVITTITIPPHSESKKPFRHILLKQSDEKMHELWNSSMNIIAENISKISAMFYFTRTFHMYTTIQRDALKQEKFKEFFDEDIHFDLMLLGYFNNDYLVGVGARYKCPIAVISLGSPYGPISRMVGNPEETSYVQFPLFGRSQPMSFAERVSNLIWAIMEPCIQTYVNYMMEKFYNNLFTANFYPKYSDVITNISLVLSNSHFSEMPIRPLVPALIEIGGIRVKAQPDPLPQDIQDFLDSSDNGAILFIVGSKSRGTSLKADNIRIIVSVLSKLDQNVLWEWDTAENPPISSSNILVKRTLSHDDILFHRNIKLYITDGRSNAIYGARHHGIPIIGIPLYANEPYMVAEMENKGFGVSVDINTLTERSFQKAIEKILENPYYTDNVKYFSSIYRDRPITARETAVFWLEYVIRHRGARHMQSPLVHMSFVERWNLDVIAVILVSIYIFIKLTKLVVFIVRISIMLRTERF